MPKFQVPGHVETERLVLRRYTADDAEQMAEVVTRNVDHLRRYMEWIKFEPQTVEQRREWIAGENANFDAGTGYTMGIFDREGHLLGGTGYHVQENPDRLEIGYWIAAEHEGKGYVTEASAALTYVALEVAGAEICDIAHAPSNTRSAAIPQRLGFERQDEPGHDGFDDGVMYPVVRWWARPEDLRRGPLASWPRPVVIP